MGNYHTPQKHIIDVQLTRKHNPASKMPTKTSRWYSQLYVNPSGSAQQSPGDFREGESGLKVGSVLIECLAARARPHPAGKERPIWRCVFKYINT